MGFGSWIHWVVVLVVVLLIFGTKKLRGAGRDLGEAVKGFKKGLGDDDKPVGSLDDKSRDGEAASQHERDKDATPR